MNASITTRNGNVYSISPATDPRVRAVTLVAGVLTLSARDDRAAEEIAREAAAWGAETYTSGTVVHVAP